MSKVSFPIIPGAINTEIPTNKYNVQVIQEDDDHFDGINNNFDSSLKSLETLPFPEITDHASVKNRIANLEMNASSQANFNKLTHQSFSNLSNNLISTEDHLKEMLNKLQENFETKLTVMKKEYDHRFELQSNENKRLQSHVSQLKADTSMLKRKLQSTIEKLRKLQAEFGDPDEEIDEESSVMTSSNFSFTNTQTRPNTIA